MPFSDVEAAVVWPPMVSGDRLEGTTSAPFGAVVFVTRTPFTYMLIA